MKSKKEDAICCVHRHSHSFCSCLIVSSFDMLCTFTLLEFFGFPLFAHFISLAFPRFKVSILFKTSCLVKKDIILSICKISHNAQAILNTPEFRLNLYFLLNQYFDLLHQFTCLLKIPFCVIPE